MPVSPKAGRVADAAMLVNVPALIAAYYELRPNPNDASQRVSFGTSGHRGSSLHATFNQFHVLDYAGDLPVPARKKDRRSPVHGHRHARALISRFRKRA